MPQDPRCRVAAPEVGTVVGPPEDVAVLPSSAGGTELITAADHDHPEHTVYEIADRRRCRLDQQGVNCLPHRGDLVAGPNDERPDWAS